jgi:spore germination protein
MTIYVVQAGDTITSIANKFGVSETRLIQDNGISYPNNLVIGQTIVITYPQEIYIVREGDTLDGIAMRFGIPIMQLYRNNPFLWDREYIYPDETLIISYDTKMSITTNAYAFPFIDNNSLRKSLPYLTYISILNYKTLSRGEIESYYDDTDLIETSKQFGVLPLMLVSGVTFRGERSPEIIYEILLNPDYQDTHAESMLKVLKEKGYYGVNITITYLNQTNQELYINYFKRIASHLNKEGFPVFVTIDPNFNREDEQVTFEKVDYSSYSNIIEESYLMRFFWGTLYGPPMPVSSISNIELYLDFMLQTIEPNKINTGFPLLGYDWTLPYIEDTSEANSITLATALDLARMMQSTIYFDNNSKTPYFEYGIDENGTFVDHLVWFVDARSINEIVNMVLDNKLRGTGLWNIMVYYPWFWLIINSNFKIEKLLPEI